MMTDEQAYTLHIIKKAITSYLDENVPNTQEGLNILLSQCDDLVWKIASNIYTQSGYKVEFYVIRDVINTRIEPLIRYISEIQNEEARRLAEQARIEHKQYSIRLEQEAKRKQKEEARRLEEETQRKQREKTITLEEEARKIAEEAYYSELKKQLKESGRDENLCYIFSKVQFIISQQLEIELDRINLDSNIQDDLSADHCDAIEIIMALEEHFEVEITDDFLEEVKIIITPPSFSWSSLSRGDIDDTHYSSNFTIGKLVDLIYKIKEQ